MQTIAWTPALAVGLPLIDQQHQELIARLQALAGAIARHQGETEIRATLTFLVEYAHFHFAAEEGHMRRTRYPGLAEHQALHARFRELLTTFHEDLNEEGVTKALADSIHTLLLHWLTQHIQQADRQFGAYMEKQGLALAE